MLQRIRIADRLTRQSAEQLVATAGAIITGPRPRCFLNDQSPIANNQFLIRSKKQ